MRLFHRVGSDGFAGLMGKGSVFRRQRRLTMLLGIIVIARPRGLCRRRLQREGDGAEQVGIRTGRGERDPDAGVGFDNARGNLEYP